MAERSVLLMATNKKDYLQFAITCAESIKLHNPGLPIYIITNVVTDYISPDINYLPISNELAGLNIEAKLYADKFLQTAETLFIDSDSICYGSLEPIFEACQGMDVTVIGQTLPLEDYWGIKGANFAREEFHIDRSILFNGGFYYLKLSALTTRIYDTARQISTQYDEYGFTRIKNKWKNEEDLLSIGMIANQQRPIADNGSYMTDLLTDRRPKKLNVLTGKRLLRNPASAAIKKRDWYPETYSPIILHFGGSNIKSYPYISQSALLKLHQLNLPNWFAALLVNMFIHIPFKSYHFIRQLLTLRR